MKSESTYSHNSAAVTKKFKRRQRRNSFDELALNINRNKVDFINPERMKMKVINTLKQLNKEMGYMFTESEAIDSLSDMKRADVIQKLRRNT